MASQRILFVINSLGMGGAERVLANLVAARGLAPDIEVHLALLDDLPQMRTIAPLDGCHQLDGRGGLWRSALQLRRLVRQLRPDVVVGFLIRSNCSVILATAGLPIRSLLCERMHTGSHLVNNHGGGVRLWAAKAAISSLYVRANRILAVSEGVRANLIAQFGLRPSQVRTIVNPYDLAAIRHAGERMPARDLPADFCIYFGRLVPAKNVAQVIEAFAVERPTCDLLILGDGPQRAELESLSHALGVGDHVHFLGFLDDPFPIVGRARFLVSASSNEGFPNAAAEAMTLGVPVILTDCPSGPAELLAAGQFGLLVPLEDDGAFRQAMRRMGDCDERARWSALARTRMEDFALPSIARLYWREFCGLEDTAR